MQRVSWSEQEKTPRGIQEYVLYVAQALAALVMVTFGRVFFRGVVGSEASEEEVAETVM